MTNTLQKKKMYYQNNDWLAALRPKQERLSIPLTFNIQKEECLEMKYEWNIIATNLSYENNGRV